MFVPLGQFAPDADSTQGNLTDILNVDPTDKGYKGAPIQSSTGIEALAAACTGAALVKTVEASVAVYAGSATKLYKLNSTSWTDVSRATDYNSTYRWRFAQFGNYTVAVNRSDATQYYLDGTSTDFADLSGAPKARIAFTVNDFCFLLGTNESGYGDQADRWWCSELGDVTGWTPDVATQCATGRLYDSPGPFTAGARLGDYAVLFKERAIYVGSYAGAPTIWNWIRVSDTIGCSSHESVQNIGQALLFANKDGLYIFDGSVVQSISANKIGEWFRNKLDKNYASNIVSVLDRQAKTVRWWFPVAGGSGALTSWISYHWPSQKWGYGESTVEAALEYATPAITYDGLATRYSTYADFPDVPYDAEMFLGGTESPAVFNSSHVLCTVSGASTSASITTGEFGRDEGITLVARVRCRYLDAPDTATLTNYYSDQVGTSFTQDVTTTEVSGKFDVFRAARWHKIKLATTGAFELTGADVGMKVISAE